MAKVIGNIVGVPNPKSDWKQTDETKADYIRNKPDVYTKKEVDDKLSDIQASGGGGSIVIDDTMSDISENAVQNKVIKKYVDERCNDIIKTITQELEITTSGRDRIPHTELVRIADAKSDALRDVTVTVDTDYVADANICYLEVYSGGTTMVEQLYRTIYNPFQGQKTAIFTFSYSGEFSVRARWENEPINAACTIRITYVRDLPEVIGNIETALDGIIEIQNSLIGGDGE